MNKPVIFLGPSLPVSKARETFDAVYLPPAEQGDIFRSAQDHPPAIGLIDGVFKSTPTVRHREILWALSKGIPVFGASSMGALRASELCYHGMIGVGLIYRWFRRFPLLPDDAVAVAHGPAALGSPLLSDALVDIRRSLQAARRSGKISSEEAQRQKLAQQSLPFEARRLPPEFAEFRVDQKARDAQSLLVLMASYAYKGNWPKPIQPEPPIVHAWLDDLRDSGLSF